MGSSCVVTVGTVSVSRTMKADYKTLQWENTFEVC